VWRATPPRDGKGIAEGVVNLVKEERVVWIGWRWELIPMVDADKIAEGKSANRQRSEDNTHDAEPQSFAQILITFLHKHPVVPLDLLTTAFVESRAKVPSSTSVLLSAFWL